MDYIIYCVVAALVIGILAMNVAYRCKLAKMTPAARRRYLRKVHWDMAQW